MWWHEHRGLVRGAVATGRAEPMTRIDRRSERRAAAMALGGARTRLPPRHLLRWAVVAALAGALAGCFQPLYGDHTLVGGANLRSALAAVDVMQIEGQPGTPVARLAVELRNELTFRLDGGGGALSPTHRLKITLIASTSSLIVDPNTARSEVEIVGLDATYVLTELASNKPVVNSTATARVSYNVPGQQQRLAIVRGQRDAQSRAAKELAEQIHARLASYFAAGT